MHERGVRAAGGVQYHQAGERDQGALPGRLRGPDKPDLHLHEHSPERVSTEHYIKHYIKHLRLSTLSTFLMAVRHLFRGLSSA